MTVLLLCTRSRRLTPGSGIRSPAGVVAATCEQPKLSVIAGGLASGALALGTALLRSGAPAALRVTFAHAGPGDRLLAIELEALLLILC